MLLQTVYTSNSLRTNTGVARKPKSSATELYIFVLNFLAKVYATEGELTCRPMCFGKCPNCVHVMYLYRNKPGLCSGHLVDSPGFPHYHVECMR